MEILRTNESLKTQNNLQINDIQNSPVKLTPEQIEEIHLDEYSFMLFHATRVEPLSLSELKRNFAEPEAGRAKSVMARFLEVELVHLTEDGKYYSNFPENYINYSSYKYDGNLETKKDSKIYQLMKQFTGVKEYWKDKTYFSIDAFFTDEQTQELIEMFKQIRVKAKEFANENAKKKSVGKLKFRRIKFYDMFFSVFLVFALFFGFTNESRAFEVIELYDVVDYQSWISLNAEEIYAAGGSGNDPTGYQVDPFDSLKVNPNLIKRLEGEIIQIDTRVLSDFSVLAPAIRQFSTSPSFTDRALSLGGGNDPTSSLQEGACFIPSNEGTGLPVQSVSLCTAQKTLDHLSVCSDESSCLELKKYLNDVLF